MSENGRGWIPFQPRRSLREGRGLKHESLIIKSVKPFKHPIHVQHLLPIQEQEQLLIVGQGLGLLLLLLVQSYQYLLVKQGYSPIASQLQRLVNALLHKQWT